MELVNLSQEHRDLVANYAPKYTLGGYSNLSKDDLNKATRHDFQLGGIAAEVGWYLYRYGNYDKLQKLLDFKYEYLRPLRKGDDGLDDSITHNGNTRKIDIKSSHTVDIDRIQYLNLVIPEREFHQQMIYVAAFTIGPSRENIQQVALAGWCGSEDVHKRWKYDPKKYCVPVNELRNLEVLKKIL